jgi:cyclopropane-fatty-acyl-phospholipid synthase
LEIGCGWGGFAEFLAKKCDVSIDCITISKNQYDFTKKRIFKSGLNNKVNVKFLDYRDVNDKYDHVASIEMIEAVGENYMDKYFQTIKKV